MRRYIIFLAFLLQVTYNINFVTAQNNNNGINVFKRTQKHLSFHKYDNDNPKATKTTVANGNWSSGSTWNGGTVPNSGDNITINHNVALDIIDSTISAGTLTISANKTLTLNSETNFYIGNTASISGTLLLIAGSNYGTWVYPAGNFTINSGGTFNCSATNTHCDFYGTANQTLTKTGTITSPLNDLSIDNAHNLTLSGSGPITVNIVNINSGNLINSASYNISISFGGMLNRGDGTIAVTPLGTLYDLMYSNILSAINTGPEFPNNTVIRDLTINSADNVTMTANATVNGNFYIYGGNLNIGSYTLTLNKGIQVGGFFGTLTGGVNSKLTLGTLGDTLSVTLPDIQTQQLNTLIIKRRAVDKITLGGNLQVTTTLEIDSGNINTGAYNLTLGTSGSTPGTLTYNAGAYTGIITGKFTRWFGTNTNAQPVKFPVGDVAVYSKPRMVTIQYTTAPTTAGTLTAQYITGDPLNLNVTSLFDNGGTYEINRYGADGYWQIDTAAIKGGTYSITIYPSGFIGMNVYAQLRVLKRPSSGTLWTLPGTHVPGTSAPTASRSGIIFTSNNGFGQFALGGKNPDNPLNGPLPVELNSFSYFVSSNNVKLTWITETEVNNHGFEIYRKSEQTDWSKIGFINGSGTSNTPETYNFTDKNLYNGKYSYKLKQIDYNGNYENFMMPGIAEIKAPNKFEVSQNYPNPFNPSTTIDFSTPKKAYVTLKIYDMSGKEIAVLINSQITAGYHSVNFNSDSYHLSSGVYFYKLSSGDFSLIKQMLLIK
jgi:hypothetical protein